MVSNLLQTKLYIPPPNPRTVQRPHLIQRLNEGFARECKITLLSAPAGYGKTTLVSSWLAEKENPVAWFSMDAGDNDPIRFWLYAIAALQTASPELGQTTFMLLQRAQTPSIENMLSDLINQITAMSKKLILVLDDYHFITSSDIHRGLNFLLDYLPPQMHVNSDLMFCPGFLP